MHKITCLLCLSCLMFTEQRTTRRIIVGVGVVALGRVVCGKMDEEEEMLLAPGATVDGRWQIVKVLGEGSFGAVYEAMDSKNILQGSMALKLERSDAKVQLLRIEVAVLRALQGTQHVCVLFACGKNNMFNFMLMSMLGPNLGRLRRKCKGKRFTFSTTCKVTFHCLRAIENVHTAGWLHRDIKPSNFAIGSRPEQRTTIFIFDFGLCRKFQEPDKENNDKGAEEHDHIRPARNKAQFRGTLRYCSVNAHKKLELGRHDDLISLLYMMVEMVKGSLPWSVSNDTNEVYRLKMANEAALYAKIPSKVAEVHQHLHTLKYEDNPNYRLFEDTLLEIIYTMGFHVHDFDWQKDRKTKEAPAGTPPKMGRQSTAENNAKLNVELVQDVVPELPQSQYKEHK